VLKAHSAWPSAPPGVRLEILPVTADGVLDTEALRVALREGKGRTLVAVMAANNETGVIQPMAEISRLAAKPARCCWWMPSRRPARSIWIRAVRLHDAVGAQAGRAARQRRADRGNEGAPFAPQLVGGGQQKGLRAGTEISPALPASARPPRRYAGRWRRTRPHRGAARPFRNASKRIPQRRDLRRNAPRLPSTSNVALPGPAGENIVIALDLDGVLVSSGSSCSSGKITPSHVLSAMGVEPPWRARRCASASAGIPRRCRCGGRLAGPFQQPRALQRAAE
jgi:cysteine desulfurase